MEVYIVWFNNFHGGRDLVGIFSTRENAQARIDGFDQSDRRSMEIESYQLD